jgi:hypothetical protein
VAPSFRGQTRERKSDDPSTTGRVVRVAGGHVVPADDAASSRRPTPRKESGATMRIVMPGMLAFVVCALPFAYLLGALTWFARSSTA